MFELTLDRDDELWDNWKNLGTSFFEQVESPLDGEESVWLLLFADALKEDGEVMMVVEGHDVNLPENLVRLSMFNGNREISSVIEAAELRRRNWASVMCSCSWFLCRSLLFWFEQ